MALMTFPATTDDFFGRLPISKATFECPEALEVSESGGGDLLVADLGERLWQGEVTLGRITRAEDADAITLIDVIRAGRTFLVHDIRRPAPRADRTGNVVGLSPVTIHALPVNNRQLRLSGLPPRYLLQRGDYIGFEYGTDPVRRAVHKVVDISVMADSAGFTAAFEVVPNIREGASVGAPVRLLRPACTAIIIPGSVTAGTAAATLTEGASFRWRQTLRY